MKHPIPSSVIERKKEMPGGSIEWRRKVDFIRNQFLKRINVFLLKSRKMEFAI